MNQAHEGMDDMAEWAKSHPITRRAHRAQPLPDNWPTCQTAPQGRPEQGWPARRCTAEPVVIIDRLPEEYDEDQSDSADGEVLGYLLKGAIFVGLALFCAWCIASYLETAYV